MPPVFRFVLAGLLAAAPLPAETAGDGVEFFEKRIRPLLEEKCIDCHGAEKQKGGLRLDSREGWTKGGESGPAAVPGKPDESLLIRGVRYWDKDFQMPPKHPLPPERVSDLIEWVKLGAPDPREGAAAVARKGSSTVDVEAGRKHWAFQPVASPARPSVRDAAWPRNEVDYFTLEKMEAAGVAPAPDADARTLIRRMTFDLTGLPPTPEEVEAFVAESIRDPQSAIRNLIERLLASPRYGERWGRHWLDVARYADTCGNASDYPVPQAHRYRDYVIAAFNADLPFDQFVREQIAGDLLPATNEEERERQIVATGYLASARHFAGGKGEPHLTIEDAIENVGRAYLGLSLSCARCHDHKFDPISTSDYYGLHGVFSSTTFPHPGSEGKNRPENLTPLLPTVELKAARKTVQDKLAVFDAEIKTHDEAKAAAQKEPDTPERNARIEAARKARDAAREQRRLLADAPPWPLAYAVSEGTPGDARLHVRGDPTRLGETVPRRFLAVLGGQSLAEEKASGRRALAEAVAAAENPLTARVMVNRIWQHHFGTGLVATPNDFGARGAPPTHPALLDFLARRFIESGWSVKAMHRLILASRTWQLASTGPTGSDAVFARFARSRLEAESVRDALLHVSGDLDLTPGGAHPFPAVHTWGFTQHNQFFASYDTPKRTVFQMQQRLRRHPFLALFDGADPNSSTAARQVSTTPLQSLFLMNDRFVHERAAHFAARVLREQPDEAGRIDRAFAILYGRPPAPEEAYLACEHLAQLAAKKVSLEKAWESLSRALLAANEFIYVD